MSQGCIEKADPVTHDKTSYKFINLDECLLSYHKEKFLNSSFLSCIFLSNLIIIYTEAQLPRNTFYSLAIATNFAAWAAQFYTHNPRWIFQALRQYWILIYHFDLFVNIYKITWNISRHCSNATETKQFRIQTIIFISEAMLWCSVISHACPFLPRTPQHIQQLSDQYCDIFRNMIYF